MPLPLPSPHGEQNGVIMGPTRRTLAMAIKPPYPLPLRERERTRKVPPYTHGSSSPAASYRMTSNPPNPSLPPCRNFCLGDLRHAPPGRAKAGRSDETSAARGEMETSLLRTPLTLTTTTRGGALLTARPVRPSSRPRAVPISLACKCGRCAFQARTLASPPGGVVAPVTDRGFGCHTSFENTLAISGAAAAAAAGPCA